MEDFYKQDPHSIGSKGLVFVGDMILVYRRSEDTDRYPLKVDLPGGGPEPGETPFDTFKREVNEEFGLDISKEDIVWARKYRSSDNKSKFAYYPVAKLPSSAETDIKFGDEGIACWLMPLEKYIKLEDAAWPVLQRRAEDYLQSARVTD